MDHGTIIFILQLIVLVAAFVFGKYIKPNIPMETITDITSKFEIIVAWAERFVAWAAYFKKDKSGKEKMEAVISQLKEIAEKYDIDITEDQLKAIAQYAYDQMKKGENNEQFDMGSIIGGIIANTPKEDPNEPKPVPMPEPVRPEAPEAVESVTINAYDLDMNNIAIPVEDAHVVTFDADNYTAQYVGSSDTALEIHGNKKDGIYDQYGNKIP